MSQEKETWILQQCRWVSDEKEFQKILAILLSILSILLAGPCHLDPKQKLLCGDEIQENEILSQSSFDGGGDENGNEIGLAQEVHCYQ